MALSALVGVRLDRLQDDCAAFAIVAEHCGVTGAQQDLFHLVGVPFMSLSPNVLLTQRCEVAKT